MERHLAEEHEEKTIEARRISVTGGGRREGQDAATAVAGCPPAVPAIDDGEKKGKGRGRSSPPDKRKKTPAKEGDDKIPVKKRMFWHHQNQLVNKAPERSFPKGECRFDHGVP